MGEKKKNIILIFLVLFFIIMIQNVSYAKKESATSTEIVQYQSDQSEEVKDNFGLGDLNEYKGSAVTSGTFKKKVNVILNIYYSMT